MGEEHTSDSSSGPFGTFVGQTEWTISRRFWALFWSIRHDESLSDTERVKLSYWTKYREIATATPEFLKAFSPQKPSKDHWTTLSCDTSAYHMSLLIDTQHGRVGTELYVPDDKEIGRRAARTAAHVVGANLKRRAQREE